MSSKRKEKKIKGTDTVPLPPPTEMANFSLIHPSEIFQRSKVPSQSILSEMTFKAPLPPLQQKILSIVGGSGSRYLNGIDHHLFMVRGITL